MSRFVVALIGDEGDALERALRERTKDLAEAGEALDLPRDTLPGGDASGQVAVVFGHDDRERYAALASAWAGAGAHVFPVVHDLKQFAARIPKVLAGYNGFELGPGQPPDELAGLVLEALGLQRARRKVFISYVRDDTMASAISLRQALTGRWYQVFQDTVSIRPGMPFQAALMQELADCDVLLMLNSRQFAERPFVRDEIAFATLADLGGVEVRWPDAPFRPQSAFTLVEVGPGALTEQNVAAILDAVARERTAMQRKREVQVVGAVRLHARQLGLDMRVHPGRRIDLLDADGAVAARLDVALGLPTSVELAMAWQAVAEEHSTRRVVFDPAGLTGAALAHLDFLARRYPFTLYSFRESLEWQGCP